MWQSNHIMAIVPVYKWGSNFSRVPCLVKVVEMRFFHFCGTPNPKLFTVSCYKPEVEYVWWSPNLTIAIKQLVEKAARECGGCEEMASTAWRRQRLESQCGTKLLQTPAASQLFFPFSPLCVGNRNKYALWGSFQDCSTNKMIMMIYDGGYL